MSQHQNEISHQVELLSLVENGQLYNPRRIFVLLWGGGAEFVYLSGILEL